MNTKTRKIVAFLAAFALLFTSLPAMAGSLDVHAVSAPAKVTGVKIAGRSTGSISISWNKIKKNKNTKGYTVYRNGYAVGSVGKGTSGFTDAGLRSGTGYSYTVRAYNTYKQKQWYNKKTGQWQKKKPKKKYRGKSRKVTLCKYGKASAAVTGVTVASAPPQTSGGSSGTGSGGTSGTSPVTGTTEPPSGGSGTTTPQRTEYVCTDYLGETHTFYKDAATGDIYWYKSGGDKVSPLMKYDKTKNGSWTDGGFFYRQKNGTTLRYKKNHECNNVGGAYVTAYNGYAAKVKLEIVEDTITVKHGYKPHANEAATYRDVSCVMSGNDRLVSFADKTYVISAGKEEQRYIDFWASGIPEDEIYGFDGYTDGTVHVNVYYDWDGNGSWESTENAGTITANIQKSTRSAKALEIAQAAVQAYGTNSYEEDMAAISSYMFNTYEYNTASIDGSELSARCNGGAEVLRVWSAYRYHVYGFVGSAPGGSDHVAFFPGRDGIEKGYISDESKCYEAQGKRSDNS